MTNVDTTQELPTVISFCSGYGGIERGLDLIGFEHRVIAYVEIEAFAVANLVNKMEAGLLPPAPIYTNLKTFPAHLFRDKVSLITGGYPCQPFSAAGERKGTDDARHLWPYIRRHIDAIRPLQCFLENVEGHISLGLSSVVSDLEQDGYSTTWGIFSAREVGAPHQRKRVYILADSSGAGQQAFRDKPRAERTAQFISESSELADSKGEFGKRSVSEGVGGRESQEAIGDRGAFAFVADSDSSGRKQSNQKNERQPPEQSYCGGVQPRGISDTDNKGLERRLQRGQSDQIGRQEQKVRCATECSDRGSWNGHSAWAPEPRVGRVVDGCPDRVDRIRMLGNGVVPQTAAKAWVTLNDRMEMYR